MLRRIVEMGRLLLWAAHYEGWSCALLRIVLKVSTVVGTRGIQSVWFQRFAERRFDSRYGVETRGVATPDQLAIPAALREHAVEYCSTSAYRFGHLLSSLAIDFEDYAFIDFGSGKGRALLMAAEFPFRHVVGVEIAPTLHAIAQRNIATGTKRRRRCRELESTCGDAARFRFPSGPLVLYFFNPFSDTILSQVVSNLETSLSDEPRHVIVVYYNPVHQDVFRGQAAFREITDRFGLATDWRVFEAPA